MPQRTCTLPECDSPHLARGYCSRHYNSWHYRGDPLAGSAVRVESCLGCGAELPPKKGTGPSPSYCSRSCRSRTGYQRRSDAIGQARREKTSAARSPKPCVGCGVEFTPETTNRQVFCSRQCSKGVQNARRRAKARDAFVEDVHWRVLFAEDGPACHLCGLDTDPDDYTLSPEGRAILGLGYPTLDHVDALAAGGSHERANARLAHFYCNSVKGARVLETVL